MKVELTQTDRNALREAAAQLREAARAKKCWPCGCLHSAVTTVESAYPQEQRPPEFDAALMLAKERLTPIRYDCIGCEVCYPAVAINTLVGAGGSSLAALEACATGIVEERPGWPPLPGDYTVLAYRAPVAICALTDSGLASALAREKVPAVAITGTLQTENLGIERVISNVISNPNIRFLILCGPDSRQTVGHLPGESLLALSRHGVNEALRIREARGKRPVVRNIGPAAIEHFQRTVEVIDLVGHADTTEILRVAGECLARSPGPAEAFAPDRLVTPVQGYLAARMIPDPAGYFVIYLDRAQQRISMEHYRNEGILDAVVEGSSAAEIYGPAVEKGLLSRLDHAAYLGRELALAELALASGAPYVQDAAPEIRASEELDK